MLRAFDLRELTRWVYCIAAVQGLFVISCSPLLFVLSVPIVWAMPFFSYLQLLYVLLITYLNTQWEAETSRERIVVCIWISVLGAFAAASLVTAVLAMPGLLPFYPVQFGFTVLLPLGGILRSVNQRGQYLKMGASHRNEFGLQQMRRTESTFS